MKKLTDKQIQKQYEIVKEYTNFSKERSRLNYKTAKTLPLFGSVFLFKCT